MSSMDEKVDHTTEGDTFIISPATDKAIIITTTTTTTSDADKSSTATTDKLTSLNRLSALTKTTNLRNIRDFDDILEVVGSFGRYQKTMMILILVPVSFFAAFTSNLFLFQMVETDHWCRTPGHENTSLSLAEWRRLTRPRSNDTDEPSKCLMYEVNWMSHNTSTSFVVTNQTKECNDGWEYDTTQFSATVATTLGWVCERGHYSHNTISISMSGNAFGTLVLPILADKYVGRRLMFYVALALHIVFTIPILWVTNAAVHMALRFLQGLTFETNYLMPYIIFMEAIPPECRALAVMASFIAWTFGMCSTALVAWLFPHWKNIAIISLFPSLLGFLYWRYLPESPRWLLSKGKVQQCADILLQIGATNGVEVSRGEVVAQLQMLVEGQPKERPLTDVLAHPRLAIRTLMLFLMSFMQFVVYSVAMLSMTVLSNSFLAHFVLSIFELPSNFLGWAVIHYFGRRFMAYSTFLLLAGFCFAAYFYVENEWILLVILGFVKLFSTCGLFVVFLMTSEVLPTPIRTSGTGITVVMGMFGMVAAPHVLHSGLGEGVHYWILFAMSVGSAVCMIPFPETLGLQLPQTFQEAEELGRDRPFTSWIHHWNFHQFMQPSTPQLEEEEVSEILLPKQA